MRRRYRSRRHFRTRYIGGFWFFARGGYVTWSSHARDLPRFEMMRLDGLWTCARYDAEGHREAIGWGTSMDAALSGAIYAPTEPTRGSP